MVNVDIENSYDKFSLKPEPRTKILNINGFKIVIGFIQQQQLVPYGGLRTLWEADMVVVIRCNGNMEIMKNRHKIIFSSHTNFEVRSDIIYSLLQYGFDGVNATYILGVFNDVAKNLLHIPMVKFNLPKHRLV